jgi:hypothetical protein
MPRINNKNYDSLLSKLDQMSSRIKKNVKNPRVANTVQEKVYDDLKENLEMVRNKYLQAQAAARKAYDLFEENLKEAHHTYSGDVRIIKGIFGRTAEDLTEFGIAPEKADRKKKEKATV